MKTRVEFDLEGNPQVVFLDFDYGAWRHKVTANIIRNEATIVCDDDNVLTPGWMLENHSQIFNVVRESAPSVVKLTLS